jgi:hypothetical protein
VSYCSNTTFAQHQQFLYKQDSWMCFKMGLTAEMLT